MKDKLAPWAQARNLTVQQRIAKTLGVSLMMTMVGFASACLLYFQIRQGVAATKISILLLLASLTMAMVGFLLAFHDLRKILIHQTISETHGRAQPDQAIQQACDEGPNQKISHHLFMDVVDKTDQLLADAQLNEATLAKILDQMEHMPGIASASIDISQELAEGLGIAAMVRGANAQQLSSASGLIYLSGDSRRSTNGAAALEERDVMRQAGTLATPIKDRNQNFGSLILEAEAGFEFQAWHIQLARVVCHQVAATIGAVNVARESRRIALMEERATIARELHDSIAQSLAFMKIQIARLETLMEVHRIPADIHLIVNDLREGLNSGYRKLRELLTTFRINVTAAGLSVSLEEAIEEFRMHSSLTLVLDNRLCDCKLTANEEIHILQIIREALSNVIRHAQATYARVRLTFDSGQITVMVEDNGKGFGESTDPKFHHGTAIMQERVKSLGGEIVIQTRPKGGARILLHFEPASMKDQEQIQRQA